METKLGEVLKAVFDRIAEFFEIFDLSFFAGGFLALGALFWSGAANGLFKDGLPLDGAYLVATVVFLSYVLGLICFALGRLVRQYVPGLRVSSEEWAKRLVEAAADHGIAEAGFLAGYGLAAKSPPREGVAKRVYIRLWVLARQDSDLKPSLKILRRYWILAATMDSVGAALLVWVMAVVWRTYPPAGRADLIPAVFFGGGAALCFREAKRFGEHQLEEAVATAAYHLKGNRAAPNNAVSKDAPVE